MGWIICLNFFFVLNASAQFDEVTDNFGLGDFDSDIPVFGNGLSFYDFNEDGWDDITLATTNHGVKVFRNNGGILEEKTFFSGLSGELKHPIWIDYDNDGDQDFFVCRNMDWPYLFRNDGDDVFTDVSWSLPCPDNNPASMCASWGDYDNDSFPDLYLGNYHVYTGSTSWLFHNDGDGTFTEMAAELGVDNGVHAAFQSLWLDYDFDNDVDLFLVNDRLHGNRLYQNNGEDGFTDIADSVGFNVPDYCMGLNTSDIDRDGDFDFYITNTFDGNKMLINNNGIFTDMAQEMNSILYNYSWGCVFIDDDNSGWEDISVMCDEYSPTAPFNHFLQNNGGTAFNINNEMYNCLVNLPSFTTAKGDVDGDGFADMVTMNVDAEQVRLWQNSANGNHFIRVTLEGTVSNRNAIGSIVRCWHNGSFNMCNLSYGNSFMSQDSQHMIIGMDDDVLVDSLTVTWPSGWVDRFYNLNVDESFSFIEGETFGIQQNLEVYMLCTGTSIELVSPEASEYLWSSGETEQVLFIDSPGSYEVSFQNEFGLSASSVFNVLQVDPALIDIHTNEISCAGANDGCIQIESDGDTWLDVSWLDNSSESERCDLAPGFYEANILDGNGCMQSLEVELFEPMALNIQTYADSVCVGSTTIIEMEIFGGTAPYTQNWYEINPEFAFAGDHPFSIVDGHGCLFEGMVSIPEFPNIEFDYWTDTICYSETTEIEFSISPAYYDYFIDWQENDPQSLTAGVHEAIILANNGCAMIAEFEVMQYPQLFLDAEIEYPTQDNILLQFEVNGGIPPYDYFINGNSTGAEISNMPLGPCNLMVTDQAGCSVSEEINIVTDVDNNFKSDLNIYPNPFSENLVVSANTLLDWRLYDVSGKLLEADKSADCRLVLNTGGLSNGVYILEVNGKRFELLRE
ncbi:MAG: VCBS repeat-containing protein [Flavobacteriales bacterium]|nr:VCBS repeat-containing protein [Flavobacteriales bacterium]